MHIVEGGLDDPRVIQLLHTHRTRARAETAPGSAYALDPSGLRAPEMTFWSAWEDDAVVGVGALKRLSADHGELKSMYTAEAARGRGVGSAMLRHIMAIARTNPGCLGHPRRPFLHQCGDQQLLVAGRGVLVASESLFGHVGSKLRSSLSVRAPAS